jgi:hypothetical protein
MANLEGDSRGPPTAACVPQMEETSEGEKKNSDKKNKATKTLKSMVKSSPCR